MRGQSFAARPGADGVARDAAGGDGNGGFAEFADLSPLQVASRHRWPILLFATAVAVLSYGALKQVRSSYQSSTAVAIDGRHLNVIGGENALYNPQPLDLDIMNTEMEVLGSPVLAMQVVRKLGLATIPEFERCTPPGIAARVRGLLSGGTRDDCVADPVYAATKLLQDSLAFSNEHDSYVIRITATSTDPRLAAAIADAYAHAYVDWRRDSRIHQADEAGGWLSSYLAGLHGRMVEADEAVENYRQTHHLIDLAPGATSVAAGGPATVASQSLAELNTQLVQADAELTQSEAELDQARHAGGATAATLSSPVVQELLERQADAEATLAARRARYGDAHPLVLTAEADLARIRQQLGAETGRTVASLENTVASLQVRKASLTAEVDRLQQGVAGESKDDVRLAELTREADTENALYRSMLERLKDIDAERHIELSDSQIVVPASVPTKPSFPHRAMMVVGAFLASLGLGVGIAFLREMTNPRFRDVRQLEAETGIGVLGAHVAPPRGSTPRDFVLRAPNGAEAGMLHAVLARLAEAMDPEAGLSPAPDVPHGGALGGSAPPAAGRVLLVTSAVPGEGKTSFAVALGRLAAQSGFRTLLFDADLRRSSLGAMIAGGRRAAGTALPAPQGIAAPAGTTAMVDGAADGALDATADDPGSDLKLMSLSTLVEDPRRILAARHLGPAFERLRAQHDLVIVDTPPILAVPDTAYLVRLADEVVVVVDLAHTTRDAVQATARALSRTGARVAGFVVSKLSRKRFAAAAGSGDAHDVDLYGDYFPKKAA